MKEKLFFIWSFVQLVISGWISDCSEIDSNGNQIWIWISNKDIRLVAKPGFLALCSQEWMMDEPAD